MPLIKALEKVVPTIDLFVQLTNGHVRYNEFLCSERHELFVQGLKEELKKGIYSQIVFDCHL